MASSSFTLLCLPRTLPHRHSSSRAAFPSSLGPICHNRQRQLLFSTTHNYSSGSSRRRRSWKMVETTMAMKSSFSATALLAATVVLFSSSSALQSPETFSNVPQTLSGEDGSRARIQRPKSRKAESCTIKCVNTCIRGGAGSPGEGPLNVRRPLVVFKQGFRSRQYCLVECSDICNLIKDGEDGP